MADVCKCGVPGFAAKSSGLTCERFGQPAHGTTCPHLIMTGGCAACDRRLAVRSPVLSGGLGSALGGINVVSSEAYAAALTDEQVQQEIQRRWPESKAAKVRMEREAKHDADRERWRKCNADVVAERDEATRLLLAMQNERDEWKRRAEAAEISAVVKRLDEMGLIPPAAVRNVLLCEGGPGIAALPQPRPEPLAFLDEDLLCDDV